MIDHKDTKDTKDDREARGKADTLSSAIIGAAIEVHRALNVPTLKTGISRLVNG
jgi:hypothetical protein